MPAVLPFGSLEMPVPGFGCMGLSYALGTPLTAEEAEPVLLKALELGYYMWDTAVMYAFGVNEKLIGDFCKKHNCRDKLFIASKCGIEVDFEAKSIKGSCNTPTHIRKYIDGSIERLGGPPDLYYLHRIDPNTPIEESIKALDEVRKAGKTKYIGVSEPSAATLRKAHSIAKIDALQAEYSAFETVHETDGLIDVCRELGIAFVAYSPIGRGFLSGGFRSLDELPANDYRRTSPKFQGDNFEKNLKIVDEFKRLADKKGVTSTQMAIAWVMAQGFIPIPGTTKTERLEENWAARDITFTDKELKELRQFVDAAKPQGDRYSAAMQAMIGH